MSIVIISFESSQINVYTECNKKYKIKKIKQFLKLREQSNS